MLTKLCCWIVRNQEIDVLEFIGLFSKIQARRHLIFMVVKCGNWCGIGVSLMELCCWNVKNQEMEGLEFCGGFRKFQQEDI